LARLDKFTEEQKRLIVALPYRTGLWVSRSDSTGGAESDAAEIAALRGIITGFAEDFCKSEFVEEIMRETVARPERWTEWESATDSVPNECAEALEIIAEKLPGPDVESFRHNLMEIGMAVALAYREFDGTQSFSGRVKTYLRYYRQRLLSALQNRQALSFDEYLNISRTEHSALSALSRTLNLEYREGLAIDDAKVG
jgi:hypothetical protein